jgi:DNA-binding transcriptional regulator PaaX
MKTPEDLKRDLTSIIIESGINHTGTVIEILQSKGWSNEAILPAIFRLVVAGTLNPNGCKSAYKEN